MDLYFDASFGISGDMAVGSLLSLGADKDELSKTLKSLNLEHEFDYKISDIMINSIKATDFDVIIPHNHHNHEQRNLLDIIKIIEKADMKKSAKELSAKIFNIIAAAEAKVHNKKINEIHFHEVGAIDSIADIISFSVLFCNLGVNNVYFTPLSDGRGTIECAHGVLNIPVPAVCEIVREYKIPIKLQDTEGEMITPTGAAIAAALYKKENKLTREFIIEKIGFGAGKRKYKNPVLKTMLIK